MLGANFYEWDKIGTSDNDASLLTEMDRENKGSVEAFWTTMPSKEDLTRSSAIP